MGGHVDPSVIEELKIFTGEDSLKNDPLAVKQIIDVINDDQDVVFIKEFIDLIKRSERKKRKRKQEREIVKAEIKKKYVKPTKKLNDKNLKVSKKNYSLLKINLHKFDLQTMVNKHQYFDLNKTTEDQIFSKIIEGLPKNNEEYYIKHSDGSPVFTVMRETKWKVMTEK